MFKGIGLLPNVLQRELRLNLQNLGAGVDSIETAWVPPVPLFITGPITVLFQDNVVVPGGDAVEVSIRRISDAADISEAIVQAAQPANTIFVAQNYNLAVARVAAGDSIQLRLNQTGAANAGRAVVIIPWRPLVD